MEHLKYNSIPKVQWTSRKRKWKILRTKRTSEVWWNGIFWIWPVSRTHELSAVCLLEQDAHHTILVHILACNGKKSYQSHPDLNRFKQYDWLRRESQFSSEITALIGWPSKSNQPYTHIHAEKMLTGQNNLEMHIPRAGIDETGIKLRGGCERVME